MLLFLTGEAMQNNPKETRKPRQGEPLAPEESPTRIDRPSRLSNWIQGLLHMGLGESLLRAATNIFSLMAILVVIWLVQMYFRQPAVQAQGNNQPSQSPTQAAPPAASDLTDLSSLGIVRQTNMHTNIPERARQDISKYTVQAGDTVSGIAQNNNLQPISIFAANPFLGDDPHSLRPGQQLIILPVDGVYREWFPGESIATVAKYFHVTPESIIDYPANHLDPTTTVIKAGTGIIIPGGVYQYHALGQIPYGISRTNPASAQVSGPGYCQPVTGGAVGNKTFVYPTVQHTLSGFNYLPKINHYGLDFAANLGVGIFATDAGVIVYAGRNNFGYGNMVMIDHGDGFQSLYAHLSQIYVSCGQSVNQGQTIGAAGTTGNSTGVHLHFEVRTLSNPINPWDVLPAP
jgi:murein DD-endopeptidase MepM/ murein hydrolase activator NlpD